MHLQRRKKKSHAARNQSSDGLDLSGKIWQEVDRVLSLPRYHHIKILRVHNSSLASIPLLPHGLEVLDLSRNHIERVQGLSNLSYLRSLDLSHNEIRRIEGLSKNYQLQELHLSHNNLRDIESLHQLQLLHTLDVRFNQFAHIDLLKPLQHNLNLRVLLVDGNEFATRAHNFQTFVFQMLSFLSLVDGKSAQQAMSTKHNYFKPHAHAHAHPRTHQQLATHDETASTASTEAAKPGYMRKTVCAKLKSGYTSNEQRQRAITDRHTKAKAHGPRKTKVAKTRASYQMQYENRGHARPSAWKTFNHYSMSGNPGARGAAVVREQAQKKQSVYTYASAPVAQRAQSIKVRDTMLSPVSSLPEPMSANSSIVAIPVDAAGELVDAQAQANLVSDLLERHSQHSVHSHNGDATSLRNFSPKRSSTAKTRMKDVIKKLNEKINKLYSWHLVEIDLVSKQQMQLNEIRTELTSTKQQMQRAGTGATATPIRGQLRVPTPTTPLRLLDTPVSQSRCESRADPLDRAVSEAVSSLTSRSTLPLGTANPEMIKTTLQKCYAILKRDNATKVELEAVENLVLQLESDMAANAQLESLQRLQIETEAAPESLDLRSETNSMIEQFNAYNDEINKLEKELKTIECVDSKDTRTPRAAAKALTLVTQPVQPAQDEKETMTDEQSVEMAPMSGDDARLMDEWLCELADELNTAKLSLRHLMDISAAQTESRGAKVKEFNVVATKCDMFSGFEAAAKVQQVMESQLGVNAQIAVQKHMHELQMTKDAIQRLIVCVVQNKQETEIQRQRGQIIDRGLVDNAQFELSLATLKAHK